MLCTPARLSVVRLRWRSEFDPHAIEVVRRDRERGGEVDSSPDIPLGLHAEAPLVVRVEVLSLADPAHRRAPDGERIGRQAGLGLRTRARHEPLTPIVPGAGPSGTRVSPGELVYMVWPRIVWSVVWLPTGELMRRLGLVVGVGSGVDGVGSGAGGAGTGGFMAMGGSAGQAGAAGMGGAAGKSGGGGAGGAGIAGVNGAAGPAGTGTVAVVARERRAPQGTSAPQGTEGVAGNGSAGTNGAAGATGAAARASTEACCSSTAAGRLSRSPIVANDPFDRPGACSTPRRTSTRCGPCSPFDSPSAKVTGTLPVGGIPGLLAISDDDSALYVGIKHAHTPELFPGIRRRQHRSAHRPHD